MKKYLTFDVGGSAIKYALISQDLNIIEKDSVPTPMTSLEDFVSAIGEIYDKYASQISGIAMSLPGIIDPDKGYNYTGGALGYITNLNTVEVLQKRCPVPITIGNDAKCAANAEIGFGSLQDVQDAAVVILGTGIGGCLIKDHQAIIGKHFSAGEFSGVKTNITKVDESGWTWSSRNGIRGLLKRVQEELETEETFNGKEIFAMANEGNEKVIKAIDRFAKDCCIQIFNIHIIFDCEKIAIGGGISAQPLLLELINKNWDEIFEKVSYLYKPEIVVCHFRNDANLIGALYQHLQTYPA